MQSTRSFKRIAEGQFVASRRGLWAIGFSLLLLSTADLTAQLTPGETLRLVSADSAEPLTQYRAYRRMHARSEKFNQEGWLEAWTELDARGFRYEIVAERGSDYIRNKVLKAVLKKEQELVASGDTSRSDLSPENYEFEEPASHGPGVRYVLIKPKRKDVLLVDGRMVLTQDGSELLRVEGRLSKNPSFWTSLVNVIRHYVCLDGVRVPISTESIAKVKFAGLAHLEVRYDYETINGRRVSLDARRTMAAAASGDR